MAKFFIYRPVFAWVVALFLMVLGVVSITQLPVSQYPNVAPPTIRISTTYPGASAQTLEDSVLSIIEREMNGSPGLMYMESVAQADGTGTLSLTFENGTNEDLAQVDVQNRLSRATPRLPSAVTQQGVQIEKARSNFLTFVMLSSNDPSLDTIGMGDYASRNILPEIQRIEGVGQVGKLQAVLGQRGLGHPGSEHPGLGRRHRRAAQPGRHADHGQRQRQGPAQHGRGIRQHRAAHHLQRCSRAPEGRGAH